MEELRIVCIGDFVKSETDGEQHYVSPRRLAELYGLDPRKCILVPRENWSRKTRGLAPNKVIHLYPRYNGQEYKTVGERIRKKFTH